MFFVGIKSLTFCMPQGRSIVTLDENIKVVSASGVDARHAYFSKGPDSLPVLCWSEKVDSLNYRLAFAKYNGEEFSEPVRVEETYGLQIHGESMGKVSINASGVITVVFRISAPTKEKMFAGSMYYTQSFDNGETWTKREALVTDTSSYSQSFFDLELLENGSTGLVWLDSRGEKGKEGSSLFFGRFSQQGQYLGEKSISSVTCQCCRTDIFTDSEGRIHVAYRKIFMDSVRDIAYIISEDNGDTFSDPVHMVQDNWVINGCPHTGPSLAENKGDIGVAWFTLGGGEGIYFTGKTLKGGTFSQRVLVDKNGKHPQMVGAGGNRYILVYEKSEGKRRAIEMVVLDKEGKVMEEEIISGENYTAQYPVITSGNNELLVSWMEERDSVQQVVWRKISTMNIE